MAIRRPWRERVWFHKPIWDFYRWSPVWLGDDEYHYQTIVIGWHITGQIVIAFRQWPLPCDECLLDETYPGWPEDTLEYESRQRGSNK